MTLKNIKSVQKTLGLLLTVFSSTMLTPIVVALIYQETTSLIFAASFAITGLFGLALWLPAKKADTEIRLHEGFIIVASFWVVLALFGALPFLLMPELGLSLTNAVFESTSGLTTTGATILTGLDELPRSLLFYRQQLQWLGGLGIVVLAVALLPMKILRGTSACPQLPILAARQQREQLFLSPLATAVVVGKTKGNEAIHPTQSRWSHRLLLSPRLIQKQHW